MLLTIEVEMGTGEVHIVETTAAAVIMLERKTGKSWQTLLTDVHLDDLAWLAWEMLRRQAGETGGSVPAFDKWVQDLRTVKTGRAVDTRPTDAAASAA